MVRAVERIKNVVKYRKILEAFQALESKLVNGVVPEKGFYLFCSFLKERKVTFFLLFEVLVEVLYSVW